MLQNMTTIGITIVMLQTIASVYAAPGAGNERRLEYNKGRVRNSTRRPVVLFHGLLAGSEAMSHAAKWIAADFPDIYIKNVEVGNGKDDSMFMNINKQVEKFAAAVKNDTRLAGGFNLIGHSQGGLITRAYVERFNDPPVHNLISWAGPHDGVFGVPDLNALCPDSLCPWLNNLMNGLLEGSWASKLFQEKFSFAAYWKPPMNYSAYLQHNIFLADINNEHKIKNPQYKARIESLNSYALVYSTVDGIVVPRTSPWFQFYAVGQDKRVESWTETKNYEEDWLGLRTLAESNRLLHYSVSCKHEDIPRDTCKAQIWAPITKSLLDN